MQGPHHSVWCRPCRHPCARFLPDPLAAVFGAIAPLLLSTSRGSQALARLPDTHADVVRQPSRNSVKCASVVRLFSYVSSSFSSATTCWKKSGFVGSDEGERLLNCALACNLDRASVHARPRPRRRHANDCRSRDVRRKRIRLHSAHTVKVYWERPKLGGAPALWNCGWKACCGWIQLCVGTSS
ncbi:hypothetical protein BKA93DRAFT_555175 [Sparassis latifolia]